jgi:hypothetical protein
MLKRSRQPYICASATVLSLFTLAAACDDSETKDRDAAISMDTAYVDTVTKDSVAAEGALPDSQVQVQDGPVAQLDGPMFDSVQQYDTVSPPDQAVDSVQPDTGPDPKTIRLKRAAAFWAQSQGVSSTDLRYLCEDKCNFISNSSLKHFCSGQCNFLTGEIKYLCSGDCNFLTGDLKYFCSGSCGFLSGDAKHLCNGNCGFISDSDLKHFCDGNCGFI